LVPDIFVNIYEKETIGGPNRIGYRRIPAKEVFDQNPKSGILNQYLVYVNSMIDD
jgi:hypothetical protein